MSCKMIDWLLSLEPTPCPPMAALPIYENIRKARLAAQPAEFQDYLADEGTQRAIQRLRSHHPN